MTATNYKRIHRQLKLRRGHASQYLCFGKCGERAQQWAYDHEDPRQLIEWDKEQKRWVSGQDMAHYRPLCAKCHSRYDVAYNLRQKEALRATETADLRRV